MVWIGAAVSVFDFRICIESRDHHARRELIELFLLDNHLVYLEYRH